MELMSMASQPGRSASKAPSGRGRPPDLGRIGQHRDEDVGVARPPGAASARRRTLGDQLVHGGRARRAPTPVASPRRLRAMGRPMIPRPMKPMVGRWSDAMCCSFRSATHRRRESQARRMTDYITPGARPSARSGRTPRRAPSPASGTATARRGAASPTGMTPIGTNSPGMASSARSAPGSNARRSPRRAPRRPRRASSPSSSPRCPRTSTDGHSISRPSSSTLSGSW